MVGTRSPGEERGIVPNGNTAGLRLGSSMQL